MVWKGRQGVVHVANYKNGGKWLNAEKAIFLQCCGSSQDTPVTSSGRIRDMYMKEKLSCIYTGGIWAGREERAPLGRTVQRT